MKLLNVVVLGQVCQGTTVRDRSRESRSKRSILSCSHDRDHFDPADGQRSIQSTNFMNFNNFEKEDRYCRWTLQTKKGMGIYFYSTRRVTTRFWYRQSLANLQHVLDSVLKVSTWSINSQVHDNCQVKRSSPNFYVITEATQKFSRVF